MKTQQKTKPAPTPEDEVAIIKRVIAESYNLTPQDIDGKSRMVPIPTARHLSMCFARALIPTCALSFPKTAELFGDGRKHPAVMNAVSVIAKRIQTDRKFRRHYAQLETKLRSALNRPAA